MSDPNKLKPGEYIDTQGMGGPMTPEDLAKWKASDNRKQTFKPAIVVPRRLFTETYAKEMKILINEVLDEREHKKRMAGAYDDVKPLPPSYFDTKHFQYRVGEEEPPYTDWSHD